MKKITRSILCDQCGAELCVDSSYPAEYSIELHWINTGFNSSGITYAVNVEKPDAVHFCNMLCLKEWVVKGHK